MSRQQLSEGLYRVDRTGSLHLRYSACRRCGAHSYPSRVTCDRCASDDLVVDHTSSTGTTFAWTEVHVSFGRGTLPTPYTVALVDFPEEVRAQGVVAPGSARLEIGQRVSLTEIVVERENDVELTTYAFVPADGAT